MLFSYSYAEDVKADPRLAGLEPGQMRTFRPAPEDMPRPGESRYLILHADKPDAFPEWENEPSGATWGSGRGLPPMEEAPRFQLGARKRQITQPDIWPWRRMVYLVTGRMLDLITEYDPDAIEARPADFRFSDVLSPDEPYYLADFVRIIDAADPARSVTSYTRESLDYEALQIDGWPGRAILQIKLPVALKPDIPTSVHVFKGKTLGIFFSREIVMEMVRRRFRRLDFWDPAIGPRSGGIIPGKNIIHVDGTGVLK